MFPIEGYPPSRSPLWNEDGDSRADRARHGAGFVQHHLTIEAGATAPRKSDGRIESFLYILSGQANLFTDGSTHKRPLVTGEFRVPSSRRATSRSQPRKRRPPCCFTRSMNPPGHRSSQRQSSPTRRNIPADVWMNNPASRLQLLIPDELQYDFAMNIFTFDPGHGLPYVETHVMEHGLLRAAGQGPLLSRRRLDGGRKGRLHLDGPLLPAELLRDRARRQRDTSITKM